MNDFEFEPAVIEAENEATSLTIAERALKWCWIYMNDDIKRL